MTIGHASDCAALDGAAPSARLVSGARGFGAACSVSTIAIAAGVLFGWATGNPILTSIVPGLVAMNPATAVCFILCGAALLAFREDARGARRWLPVALGALVGACGLVRLLAYVFAWNLPVDTLLFASRVNVGSIPNRMAPNTAFNFCLDGLALACLPFGRPRLTQLLALGAAFTGFIALLGYAYSASSLVRVATFIPMALHTAVLFLLVAAAVLCVTPERGVAAAVTSKLPGGRVIRRMIPTLLVAPPLLGWLRLQGEFAGLYGPSFGVALTVGVMVAMGLGMTWLTARAVDRSDFERRRAEEIALRLAHFDKLTGLPNRALFDDRLRQALARARRSKGTVALLFLDLDGFKQVNDRFGHEGGDQVLKEAARRIATALRSVDTAARLGGDEFTVVLEAVKTVEDVEMVARRLLLMLSSPYPIADTQAWLSASVGVGLYPGDSELPSELLSLADAAMYRAKRAGKNQVAFHAHSPGGD